MRPDRARGFTLLEAVVALAILSAAGMALFASMTQSVQMVNRASEVRADDVAMRNALAWIEQLNPTQDPEGEAELGNFTLRWTSRLVEPALPSATGYLEPGLHEVGLYQLRVEIWRGDVLRRDFEMRRLGWRQVRTPEAI